MLKRGDKVALAACSDAFPEEKRPALARLAGELSGLGLTPVCSRYLFSDGPGFGSAGRQRAGELTGFFRDPDIKAIFDVTGGDLAGDVLDYLDYKQIGQNPKPFFGYSDVTSVLNAIYTKTGMPVFLYQLRNLIEGKAEEQRTRFEESLLGSGRSLYQYRTRLIRGDGMEGTVVGGNIRCLLKLAGTPYFPPMEGKLLFLESRSAGPARIGAFFSQLRQMGVFGRINGLLLGTFTEMRERQDAPGVEALALSLTDNPGLPIAVTEDIGHGSDSRCLVLGRKTVIQENF